MTQSLINVGTIGHIDHDCIVVGIAMALAVPESQVDEEIRRLQDDHIVFIQASIAKELEGLKLTETRPGRINRRGKGKAGNRRERWG